MSEDECERKANDSTSKEEKTEESGNQKDDVVEEWIYLLLAILGCLVIIIAVPFLIVAIKHMTELIKISSSTAIYSESLLNREHVTRGESFHRHVSKCVSLGVTMNPGPFNFTAYLDVSNTAPQLRDFSEMSISHNDVLTTHTKIEDWVFHLHAGSTLSLSICAHAPKGDEVYTFSIIKGQDNFVRWQDAAAKEEYVLQYYVGSAGCKNYMYTYESHDGDYYHVLQNIDSDEYSIQVEFIFNRTQYRVQYETQDNCIITNERSTCQLNMLHVNHAIVVVDDDGEKVNGTETASLMVTCEIKFDAEKKAIAVFNGILFITILVALITFAIIGTIIVRRRRNKTNNNNSTPNKAPG